MVPMGRYFDQDCPWLIPPQTLQNKKATMKFNITETFTKLMWLLNEKDF